MKFFNNILLNILGNIGLKLDVFEIPCFPHFRHQNVFYPKITPLDWNKINLNGDTLGTYM